MLIGSALKVGGEAWVAAHKRQMDWLDQSGITPAEAVAAYDTWEAERLADPLWQEMSEKCRSQVGQ